jgi:hypothetical protein
MPSLRRKQRTFVLYSTKAFKNKAVAKWYGISKYVVSKIKRNKTWNIT